MMVSSVFGRIIRFHGACIAHCPRHFHIGDSLVGRPEQLRTEHNIIAGIEFKTSLSFIEDWMCNQQSEATALALICLLSICSNGLSTKDYTALRTLFLHAYGHKHLLTWHNLKRLGVLFEKESSQVLATKPGSSGTAAAAATSLAANAASLLKRPAFQTFAKKWTLHSQTEDVDLRTPTDLSYIYNGAYIPVACQLTAHILRYGFSREELSKSFFCPMFQRTNNLSQAADSARTDEYLPRKGTSRAVLVYFIGGVTHAELAGFRLLEKLNGIKIVVATTHIINRASFIQMIAKS